MTESLTGTPWWSFPCWKNTKAGYRIGAGSQWIPTSSLENPFPWNGHLDSLSLGFTCGHASCGHPLVSHSGTPLARSCGKSLHLHGWKQVIPWQQMNERGTDGYYKVQPHHLFAFYFYPVALTFGEVVGPGMHDVGRLIFLNFCSIFLFINVYVYVVPSATWNIRGSLL